MTRVFALVVVIGWELVAHGASIFHVSSNGSHTFPFSSTATAATNIMAAVDLTVDGDTVVLEPGTYSLTSSIVITNAIQISGPSDPTLAIVDGGSATRCFVLSNVGCVLSGLTIQNGDGGGSLDGGGVYGFGETPIITNCVVRRNAAVSGGGIFRCTVFDTRVEDNSASFVGGGAYESSLMGCVVINNVSSSYGGGCNGSSAYQCVIKGNRSNSDSGGLEDCLAVNCLIERNVAALNGGGASYSQLINCTVVQNIAEGSGGGLNYCESLNTIVFGNTADSINDIYDPNSTSHSCSPDLVAGVNGNIIADPELVMLAGDNYHLVGITSPCFNAGTTNGLVALGVDLDGRPRLNDGAIDIGAYEVQRSSEDLDGDGMLDTWESQYFISGTNALPQANDDFDESYNLQEFIAGTDPTNGMSYFSVTNWDTGSFVLEWPSYSNRVYSIHWTDGLNSGLQEIATGIEWPVNAYTDTAHAATSVGFYRVEVRLK